MGEGAGDNCPPHFENLRVCKTNSPFFGIKLKKKLFYFSMEAYIVQLAKGIRPLKGD